MNQAKPGTADKWAWKLTGCGFAAALVLAAAGTAVAEFCPTNLAGCVLWLDGSDPDGDGLREGAGETNLTGAAVIWADKSGNGRNFEQTAAARQPAYTTNGFRNATGAFDFTGSNGTDANGDCLVYTNAGPLAVGDDDYTYVVVWHPDLHNQYRYAYSQGDGAGNGERACLILSNAAYGFNGMNNDANGFVPSAAGQASLTILELDNNSRFGVAGGPNVRVYDEGTLYTATTGNPGALNVQQGLTVVGSSIGTTEFFDGKLAEIVVYDRVLDAAEMNAIGWHLAQKYAFTVPYMDPDVLSVRTDAATGVALTSATLNGYLSTTGGVPADVWVFWGETDGGTHVEAWANAEPVGTLGTGPFSAPVTNLARGTSYFCRHYADDGVRGAWAGASVSFSTPATASFTSLRSGNWSDAALWTPAGGPPQAADAATVAAGHKVTNDTAAAATVATLTVTGAGARLDLARDFSVPGAATVAAGGSLNLGPFDLGVNTLTLNGAASALTRGGGAVTGVTLNVQNGNAFTLGAADRFTGTTTLSTPAVSLTTAATNNLTGALTFQNSTSTLHLGADLRLGGAIGLAGSYVGWIINTHGYNVTVNGNVASYGGVFAGRETGGTAAFNAVAYLNNGIMDCFRAGDFVNDLRQSRVGDFACSRVTMTQRAGETAGLTVNNLYLDTYGKGNARLTLAFDAVPVPSTADWGLRWSGRRVTQLSAYAANGQLVATGMPVAFDAGRHIWYSEPSAGGDGYTYVGYNVPPVVRTDPADGIDADEASLHGFLVSTGDAPAQVWVYWGASDGGINPAAWAHTNQFEGYPAVGPLATNLSGLARGTVYYCRFFARNAFGAAWATNSASFRTFGVPVVRTDAATVTGNGAATLSGFLVDTGGAPARVWAFWGEEDGADHGGAARWAHTNAFTGVWPVGALGTNVTGLTRHTTYYCRFFASNDYGSAWATSSVSFRPAVPTAFVSAASGLWSQGATWNLAPAFPLAFDTVTIAAGHSVTNDAAAAGACAALTLNSTGSRLTLTQPFAVSGNAGLNTCTLEFGGNLLTVGGQLTLNAGTTLLRTGGGGYHTTTLYAPFSLAFGADDETLDFYPRWGGDVITTASPGNIRRSWLAQICNGTLNLGADLELTGYATFDRMTVRLNGHSLRVPGNVTLGALVNSSGGSAVTDRGASGNVDIGGNLALNRASTFNMRPGDIVRGNYSTDAGYNSPGLLNVTQGAGETTGLTLDGGIAFGDANDRITVNFDAGSPTATHDWGLRWKGDRAATLQGWYGTRLFVNGLEGFDPARNIYFVPGAGYTYVGGRRQAGALLIVR